MVRALVTVIAVAFLIGACSPEDASAEADFVLTPIAKDFDRPIALTVAPGDATRLFITEQPGRVRVVKNGKRLGKAFLDISNRVSCCGERGLLSIAFHPAWQANGYFFANYTDPDGNTVVSRFQVHARDPDVANPASESIVLTVIQPFANHNGGQLQFGPDGYLYIGMGDGGSGGDPGNRAQDLNTLLGKMLRIDVDRDASYSIPPTNPFIGKGKPELWAIGLRNPWRFSFDQATGDLYIGDVGQGQWEEIDHQPASSHGGENYGWRLMEGMHCYQPSTGCDDGTLVKPVAEYSHAEGCSVTGGYVYRGKSSRLNGTYIYGDYCTGVIKGAVRDGSGRWTSSVLLTPRFNITSFGQDEAGEVYVVNYAGTVLRIDDTRIRRRPARPSR